MVKANRQSNELIWPRKPAAFAPVGQSDLVHHPAFQDLQEQQKNVTITHSEQEQIESSELGTEDATCFQKLSRYLLLLIVRYPSFFAESLKNVAISFVNDRIS